MSAFFRNKLVVFLLIAFCCLFIEITAFLYLGGIFEKRLQVTLFNTLLETVFLVLPFIVLSPKWRAIWIGLLVVFSIFLLTDIWYLRHFGTFYDGDILFSGNIFDSIVVNSAEGLFRLLDLLLVLPTVFIIVAYCLLYKSIVKEKVSLRIRLLAAAAMLIIPIIIVTLTIRRMHLYINNVAGEKAPLSEALLLKRDNFIGGIDRGGIAYDYGSVGLFVNFIYRMIPESTPLTEKRLEAIERLLARKADHDNPLVYTLQDTIEKNLILIIVESWNSTTLDDDFFASVAPTLYEFVTDSAVILAERVHTQAYDSANGQFILNTGLMPFSDKPIASSYATADYPSLAKALKLKGYYSLELIGEDRDLWKHQETSLSYGYDNLIDNIIDLNDYDWDKGIIDKAIEVLDTVRQPFFMEITTLGMHVPYDEPAVTDMPHLSGFQFDALTENSLNYLTRLYSLDVQLSHLINVLKQKGIYSNTLIVLTGDHAAPENYIGERLRTDMIPFLVLNSGINLRFEKDMGQIDIFPTLFDIMNVKEYKVKDKFDYSGLGTSILRGNTPVVGDSLQSVSDVCETIIRTRYFKSNS